MAPTLPNINQLQPGQELLGSVNNNSTVEADGVLVVGTACSSRWNIACEKDGDCYKDSTFGRICSSPDCEYAGKVQSWDDFYKKGNRYTSKCKSCTSKERKLKYKDKKKKSKNKTKSCLIGKVYETELQQNQNVESETFEQLLQEMMMEIVLDGE